MAIFLNRVCLIGNLGADPEIRYMADGVPMATFSLATTDAWKDKEGKKQKKTEWHRIVLYKGLAEVAGRYFKKGAAVYLEGKIRSRNGRRGGNQAEHYGDFRQLAKDAGQEPC